MNPTPNIHFLDYFIMFLTLVVSLGVGFWFSKRQKDTNNYFKAAGSIPSWAIGISILATLISSITFLAYPGEGYTSNWIRLVQGLMVPIVLVAIVGFVVPLFRHVIQLSTYEYFEKRFGKFARFYTSISFILTHFSKMGTVFFLISLALSKMIGLDTVTIIWIIGAAVILLTMLGGIEAVIWLDVIQGFLLIIGGVIALGILLFTPEGGPMEVWRVAMANDRIGFGPFDWDFVHLTFWVMALNGVFYAIQKYGTDQTIVQRYLTAKTDKAAIKASLIGVLLSVPVWAMFMFIGTALFSYYKITGAPLPADIEADAVFPYFILTKLPVGIVGLILSALMAAAISSLDSDLNCLSAILMEDYYKRIFPKSTDKQQLMMGRLFIVLAGLGAIAVALFYVNAGSEGVLGIIFTLYAIFSGGIAGMFLLGIFSTRANKQGLYWGIGASILFTAWALLTSTPIGMEGKKTILLDLGNFNYTQHKYMIGVYSHVVLIVVGYVGSLCCKGGSTDISLTWVGWKQRQKQLNKA
ncbi:sodium:solute symporter [Mangrovibacterium marinum]|uniref:SSS family solute:Na+ symporter n=1 Tax=Mangrovibacterium marinum TaxID=1639118 RepID=A0A2T5C434_9BACT|nr:sodium:solute symporter [Mangrovibacterium marinum]PTN09542.1 SSS family solute:Na+ symporter [Mangrovibacterium marinum]